MIGEIGGNAEEQAAEYLAEHNSVRRPIILWPVAVSGGLQINPYT